MADIDNINIDKYTKAFLRGINAHPTDPPKVREELTYTVIQKGFKIWNEQTSSSPLGTYLGLYKVWFKSMKKEEESTDEITTKEFFKIIAKIVRMAIQLTQPLQRWLTVHKIYSPKDPGNTKMSRLCALRILCAILNLTRGIYIAKRTMTQAEKYNHLDNAQYRGQKGREAIEPA
eukprot:2133039-Ditylum_brightwellii.AAC.1